MEPPFSSPSFAISVLSESSPTHLFGGAAALLYDEWPKTCSLEDRLNWLRRSKGVSDESPFQHHEECLPVSVVACSNDSDNVLGHGRLERGECDGQKRIAIVYSVVIKKSWRGQGIGKAVMDTLETIARRRGVDYVYLSTRSAEAFYTKLGYYRSSAVTHVSKALLRLDSDSRQRLECLFNTGIRTGSSRSMEPYKVEAMTSRKNLESDCNSGEQGSFNSCEVWMRKRVGDRLLGRMQWAASEELLHAAREFAFHDERMKHTSIQSTNVQLSTALSSGKWKLAQQIGPSCGLACLIMAMESMLHRKADGCLSAEIDLPDLSGTGPLGRRLLDYAQKKGFSRDGEIFSAAALADVAQATGLFQARVVRLDHIQSPSIQCNSMFLDCAGVVDSLHSGGILLMPYDLNSRDFTVGFDEGRSAHWCCVIGYQRGNDKDSIDDERLSERSYDSVMLLCVQPKSLRPFLTKLSSICASCCQLKYGRCDTESFGLTIPADLSTCLQSRAVLLKLKT